MDAHARKPIRFDDVADLYDYYVQTEFDIPFWISEAKAAAGNVLELTCGTGRVSIPLLKAGINLTCVDYAPGMLSRFRQKLKDAHLTCPVICQDISALNIPGLFDLIFIPFHSFAELVEERRRRSALKCILTHLSERGVFICTLQNPPVRTSTMDGTTRLIGEFALPEGERLVVSSNLSFDASSHLAEGIQLYDRYAPDGRVIDHRTLGMCFYLFHYREFGALVRQVGFDTIAVHGDYDCTPYDEQTSPFMIWKLRKHRAGA